MLSTGGTATVGYGETGAEFIDRFWGRRITQAEALAKMAERVPGFHQGVLGCIDADLTDHQWEAITCRAYQTGAGGFCRSDTAELLRVGDIAGALDRWRQEFAHPDRSEVEIAHFLTPDDGEEAPMKFVSRAEWGAAAAGGRTSAPGMTRGVGVHWLGEGRGPTSHGQCAAKMREVQAFHTDTRGWADFAYNAAVCCHGYVFEGRGRRVRNAANGGGTRAGVDANAGWASVLYLAGTDGPELTPEAKDGINDAAEHLGVAGGEWLGHRDFLSTECPGDAIYGWVHAGHPRSGAPAAPGPAASKEDQLFSQSPVYTVHLIASHSGLLLTSSAAEHGAGVIQRKADGSLNQRWEVYGHDDGTATFVNRAGGFALDRPDYSTEPATLLQVARNEFNDAQRWVIDETQPHVARLWAPGTNRCVDVRMRSEDEGAGAQLWTALRDEDDPRHQRFILVPTI